jgi:hypothetical protein
MGGNWRKMHASLDLFRKYTSRPVFDGETISDTIAAILGRDVDWE